MPSSYLLINDLRFHYLRWGESGPPVVLLHGLASNARIWELVGPRLADAGLRVFALDQRNHGLTDPAESGFDFPAITRDLIGCVEALNLERPLLVGHSWGASTALHAAAARPGLASGLVMVDGGCLSMREAPGMTWEKAEAILRPPDLDGMPREAFVERLRAVMDGFFSEAAADIVLANFSLDEDDRIYRRLPVPRHMQIARALYDQDVFSLYPRLQPPALLCLASPPPPLDERGQQFLALKRSGAERAEALQARVRTLWFDDTVHDIPLHRPAELAAAILDFQAHVSGK